MCRPKRPNKSWTLVAHMSLSSQNPRILLVSSSLTTVCVRSMRVILWSWWSRLHCQRRQGDCFETARFAQGRWHHSTLPSNIPLQTTTPGSQILGQNWGLLNSKNSRLLHRMVSLKCSHCHPLARSPLGQWHGGVEKYGRVDDPWSTKWPNCRCARLRMQSSRASTLPNWLVCCFLFLITYGISQFWFKLLQATW